MSTETHELIRLCESLPENKREELADFARFLLAQQDDQRWEESIASGKQRPKLNAFLKQSATEPSTPLDADRL